MCTCTHTRTHTHTPEPSHAVATTSVLVAGPAGRLSLCWCYWHNLMFGFITASVRYSALLQGCEKREAGRKHTLQLALEMDSETQAQLIFQWQTPWWHVPYFMLFEKTFSLALGVKLGLCNYLFSEWITALFWCADKLLNEESCGWSEGPPEGE